MAKSLDAILAELNPQYQSSQDLINARLNAIPDQTNQGIAQADAKLSAANDNILSSARSRGTGVAFGGIPLAQQAQYAATDYAPAIANLKASGQNAAVSLQEQLNQLTRDKSAQAQSIYDTGVNQDLQERQFQESVRQFNEQQAAAQRAAAAAASAGSYGFGGGVSQASGGAAPAAAKVVQNGKNFNFFDGTGKAINAAQYSQLTGREYRSVLAQLASAGDANAKLALNYVGNDGKYGNQTPANVRAALAAVGATAASGNAATNRLSNGVTVSNSSGSTLKLPAILNGRY